MDHSLRSYLEKQSSEKLGRILRFCIEQEDIWFYEDVFCMAWDIVLRREAEERNKNSCLKEQEFIKIKNE